MTVIRDIVDESYHRDSTPYIYTNGKYWFILHYTSKEKAESVTPEGYNCNLYISTSQIPRY